MAVGDHSDDHAAARHHSADGRISTHASDAGGCGCVLRHCNDRDVSQRPLSKWKGHGTDVVSCGESLGGADLGALGRYGIILGIGNAEIPAIEHGFVLFFIGGGDGIRCGSCELQSGCDHSPIATAGSASALSNISCGTRRATVGWARLSIWSRMDDCGFLCLPRGVVCPRGWRHGGIVGEAFIGEGLVRAYAQVR